MWVAVVGSGFGTVSDAGDFFYFTVPCTCAVVADVCAPKPRPPFVSSGQNVQVFVGKRPCLDSVPRPINHHLSSTHAPSQVWISPRLVLCCLPPAAGGTAHLAVVVGGVRRRRHHPCVFMFAHRASACRCCPYFGKRNRVRITTSHFRCSQKLAHVRWFLCNSPWPPLRTRRHHRQVTVPPRLSASTAQPFALTLNCSIKVGGSSCAQNMWFSDSSILCKVRRPARVVPQLTHS